MEKHNSQKQSLQSKVKASVSKFVKSESFQKKANLTKSMLEKLRDFVARFKELPYPEKMWTLNHLFIAKKAWEISTAAKDKAKQMAEDADLDKDTNGGQVSAFRHAFLMAMLVKEISPQAALKLGKAYEKTNRIFYRKNEQDNTPHDRTAEEMNMKNNEAGVRIGLKNIHKNEQEIILALKKAIHAGELWIIKKTKNNNFLDWEGNIIPKENYHKKWYNPKCLVPSDFHRPEETKTNQNNN